MGLFDVLGSFASGVTGSVGQGFLGDFFSRRAWNRQREENRYWAEYNTPVNQMARFREAGLNPNLVYGQGSAAGTYNASVGPSSSPSIDAPKFLDYMNFKNMKEQNKNLVKQGKQIDASTEKEKELAAGVKLDNLRKASAVPQQQGYYDLQDRIISLKRANEELRKTASETALNNFQSSLISLKADRQYLDNQFFEHYSIPQAEAELYNKTLQNTMLELQRDNFYVELQSRLNLNAAQCRELSARCSNLVALSALYHEQKNEVVERTKGYAVERRLKRAQASLDEYMKKFNADENVRRWIESSVNEAATVSSEIRSWVYFWSPNFR